MLKLVLLAIFASAALAAPVEVEVVPIISQEMDIEPEGKFHWSYESGDGTKAAQFGESGAYQGSFEYKGVDGKVYSVSYTADATGYHPVGEHIPVAPEVPVAIQKALVYLATAPPPKNV